MELIIQTNEFTVRVDTEARIKEGDIMCGYVQAFTDPEDRTKDAIPAYWYLKRVKTKTLGNFFTVVDKHYKVTEIIAYER